MLRLNGSPYEFCDGLSRRSFLRIGGLGLGGLALPQLLRAQSESPARVRSGGLGHKAVIMVYMPGGPPHQDMYDLKLDDRARLKLPADWVQFFNSLGEKTLFVTSLDDRIGRIYPMSVWRENEKLLDSYDEDPEAA